MSRPFVRATWPIPLLLALASIVGLIAALTGDGWRDAISWAGLGLPILTIGWAIHARRHHKGIVK